MGALAGSRIVLGVTGGIAAYKAVEVCRRLVDEGAHVVPVLTAGARRMVGETTFSALASEPARTSLWDDPRSPIPHTDLGRGADAVVVAPATARLLADYRTGRSGDLLTATLLATRAPVVVAPAMHAEMWEQPSVQENLEVLAGRGVTVVPPAHGRLAGGDVGMGRMAEPSVIVSAVQAALDGRSGDSEGGSASGPVRGSEVPGGGGSGGSEGGSASGPVRDFEGRRVLVTAGGTREPIDAVRFIGNRSSGRQGGALAEEAAARGAEVVLVTTRPERAPAGVRVIPVETAAEMAAAVDSEAAVADVVVMAAAVADFRPADPAPDKIKKNAGVPEVRLAPTADILASLGSNGRDGRVVVGFAAETGDLEANARAKLEAKRLDVIVANDVSKSGAGFEHDTNEVLVLTAAGGRRHVPLTTKREVAKIVLDTALGQMGARTAEPAAAAPAGPAGGGEGP